MNFLSVILLMMLAACHHTVSDYSFVSMRGVAVERATPVIATLPGEEPVREEPAACEQTIEDHIYFDTNSYELCHRDRMASARYAKHYRRYGTGNLIIDGHCDERGTREYNMGLGSRRAAAVKDALVAGGIEADRITVRSFGKEKPLIWGSTPDAWAKNRVAIIRQV